MSKNSENKDLKSAMFKRASNRIFKGLELNDKQTFKPFCFVQMADSESFLMIFLLWIFPFFYQNQIIPNELISKLNCFFLVQSFI